MPPSREVSWELLKVREGIRIGWGEHLEALYRCGESDNSCHLEIRVPITFICSKASHNVWVLRLALKVVNRLFVSDVIDRMIC